MEVLEDPASGQLLLMEDGKPVLAYNYSTVEPGEVVARTSPANLKYARPRSNYIHPLIGPGGETLTLDWPVDHPHHRGIYWAWPEVEYGGELGDLHALQRVFARPTGRKRLSRHREWARIEAENFWEWDDRGPVVREVAIIHTTRSNPEGRFVDLEFYFTALKDGVSLARRGTNAYGGLNIRLTQVEEQQIDFHTGNRSEDPPGAWAELSGSFPGGETVAGISVFQHPSNPDYPGDWVQFPELNWFQPTFPASGTRYALAVGEPLVLRFRLWVHRGRMSERAHSDVWKSFSRVPPIGSTLDGS